MTTLALNSALCRLRVRLLVLSVISVVTFLA